MQLSPQTLYCDEKAFWSYFPTRCLADGAFEGHGLSSTLLDIPKPDTGTAPPQQGTAAARTTDHGSITVTCPAHGETLCGTSLLSATMINSTYLVVLCTCLLCCGQRKARQLSHSTVGEHLHLLKKGPSKQPHLSPPHPASFRQVHAAPEQYLTEGGTAKRNCGNGVFIYLSEAFSHCI